MSLSTSTHFKKPLGPFAVLYEQRATPDSKKATKKTAPKRTKLEWALIGLETSQQRTDRQAAERKAAQEKILAKNKYMEIGLSTVGACDRAASIRKTAI